jgi:hypothetical protein
VLEAADELKLVHFKLIILSKAARKIKGTVSRNGDRDEPREQ